MSRLAAAGAEPVGFMKHLEVRWHDSQTKRLALHGITEKIGRHQGKGKGGSRKIKHGQGNKKIGLRMTSVSGEKRIIR